MNRLKPFQAQKLHILSELLCQRLLQFSSPCQRIRALSTSELLSICDYLVEESPATTSFLFLLLSDGHNTSIRRSIFLNRSSTASRGFEIDLDLPSSQEPQSNESPYHHLYTATHEKACDSLGSRAWRSWLKYVLSRRETLHSRRWYLASNWQGLIPQHTLVMTSGCCSTDIS